MKRPEHTSFMDEDMRKLLERMKASDLEGYRLQGGTALAMYTNHRSSTHETRRCFPVLIPCPIVAIETMRKLMYNIVIREHT